MTTLQEIKAMLERAYNSSAFDERELDKLLAFTRAALPVIEAANDQRMKYSNNALWTEQPQSYRAAVYETENQSLTFTESYPDATA